MWRGRSRRLPEQVKLPAGYSIQWSGQYEYMQEARKRLNVVVPVTLVIIFLLLYLNFRNVIEVMIVMLALPFAVVGGIWFMYLLGYNMSVAVMVGFIALAGVAAETGVVMIIYLDHAFTGKAKGESPDGCQGPLRCHHGGSGRAGAAEDDDGQRHHRGPLADHVEQRDRGEPHEANRRPDGRRHGLVHRVDPDHHPDPLPDMAQLGA